MELKGVKNCKVYTINIKAGKVWSILVETQNSYERKFYQRGPVELGLVINDEIFEKAVLAIGQKNLVSWMELYDAIWADKTYGQEMIQKIFERHLFN